MVNWIPATKPRIVSLNINNSTGVKALRRLKNTSGDLPNKGSQHGDAADQADDHLSDLNDRANIEALRDC